MAVYIQDSEKLSKGVSEKRKDFIEVKEVSSSSKEEKQEGATKFGIVIFNLMPIKKCG